MRFLFLRLEGLALTLVGGFFCVAVLSRYYPYLMNPRYKWLSLIGFAGILVLGIVRILRFPARPRLSRLVPIVMLLVLTGVGIAGLSPSVDPRGAVGTASAAANERRSQTQVEADDLPAGYLPINTGELYLLAKAGLAVTGEQQRYVLRGVVKRTPELEKRGEFALVRIFMYCCAADATAVGFRVAFDAGVHESPPELPADGRWVRVAGRLEPLSEPTDLSGLVRMDGTFYTALQSHFRLVPDGIERIEAPDPPFIYEIRAEPPYAY